MKKPPTYEQALTWASVRASLVMHAMGTQSDEYILMLLHYIRKLEKTAAKEDIVEWD